MKRRSVGYACGDDTKKDSRWWLQWRKKTTIFLLLLLEGMETATDIIVGYERVVIDAQELMFVGLKRSCYRERRKDCWWQKPRLKAIVWERGRNWTAVHNGEEGD